MNLLPFDSPIANVLLLAVYAGLLGGIANAVVAIGFRVLDSHSLRRR